MSRKFELNIVGCAVVLTLLGVSCQPLLCATPAKATAKKPSKAAPQPPAPTNTASADDATPDAASDTPSADDTPTAPVASLRDMRSAISGSYTATDAAFSEENIEGLLQCYDPAFENVDKHGGVVNLQGVRDGLTALFGATQSAQCATRVLGVSPVGKSAAQVDVKQHIVLVYVDPTSGENSRITMDNVCRDFWQLGDTGWLKRRSRLVSTTRRVQGVQPILPIMHW